MALISSDTIYALSTGQGSSAIAVIRLSGEQAIITAESMAGKKLRPRYAELCRLFNISGDLLDEALVLSFPDELSFTSEPMAELQVHGGPAVIKAVLSDLADRGLRAADPGEFSRRAFLSGKIDLVEVEGLGDLIHASTEAQRLQALNQYGGSASTVISGWKAELVRVLAHIEALIDFSDEEHVSSVDLLAISTRLNELVASISRSLKPENSGERLRDGYRVVLAGAPNVGKSSIFNYLMRNDRAIISDIAGTTRDVLDGLLDIKGLPVILSDTAGLNSGSTDVLELEGIRRSKMSMDSADLVLWVASGDGLSLPENLDSDPIFVWNKADILACTNDEFDWLSVSVKDGTGFDVLLYEIYNRINGLANLKSEDLVVTRDRHRQCLSSAVQELEKAVSLSNTDQLELLAEALRLSLRWFERLTGRVDVEDLLDVIFRDFCIGK